METFRKYERLCSYSHIKLLFAEGSSINCYPIRVVWRQISESQEVPIKVVFSVSKRNFKKAVDRNRIKRLLREVYRKNKHEFNAYLLSKSTRLQLMFIYTGKELPDFFVMEKKIKSIFARLEREYEQNIK